VAAVAELPDSQRKAIVGREFGGFTHDEIAQQLNLSTGATKQLIYRARLTLLPGRPSLPLAADRPSAEPVPSQVVCWPA